MYIFIYPYISVTMMDGKKGMEKKRTESFTFKDKNV